MAKKKKKAKRVAGGCIVSPRDKDAVVIDFDRIQRESGSHVQGTAADLIRDGYDFPRRWVHNSEALPDDNRRAFLIGRGYSATVDKRFQVSCRDIPIMAINDFPKDGPKPDYWCTGDPPNYFGERIWTNPDILKFCPFDFMKAKRPAEDAYATQLTAMDAPNTHFFHHCNNETEYESWLHTPWIAWGTTIHGKNTPKQFYEHGAARCSMLIGIRLLWHLGFREVCLLGCDCAPHSHPAPEYWNTVFHLCEQIRPTLGRWGMKVYQTNFDSHLRVFDFMEFEEAIKR